VKFGNLDKKSQRFLMVRDSFPAYASTLAVTRY